jgi:hypothetical protein
MTILQQMERMWEEISRLKPRSRRRLKLEMLLQTLMLQQLRREIRMERRK